VRYVCDEAQNKLGETWKTSEWTVSAPKDIPKQLNGCDCGVFMLNYVDWVVRSRPRTRCLLCKLAPGRCRLSIPGTQCGAPLHASGHAVLPQAHHC
jgi:hypothetical protein